jgi:hypothetical protein
VFAHALNGSETDNPTEILRVQMAGRYGRLAAGHDRGADARSGDGEDAEAMAAAEVTPADLRSGEHVIAGWPGRT